MLSYDYRALAVVLCEGLQNAYNENQKIWSLQHEQRLRYEDSPTELSGWITLFKETSYGKTWFYVTTKFNPLFLSQ